MTIKLPTFGTLLTALNDAGVRTGSARGFWGGVTPEDEIVVTAWTDASHGNDRFHVTRPSRRHGGLRDAWDLGRIEPGVNVRLILVRQRGDVPLGQGERQVKDAALMPGQWRVIELLRDDQDRPRAIVEPVVAQ